jgi:hypothetical protein
VRQTCVMRYDGWWREMWDDGVLKWDLNGRGHEAGLLRLWVWYCYVGLPAYEAAREGPL